MNKKIYIITRHAVSNYGSLLQTIATSKIFENYGYETKIIDYISKKETIINNLKNFANNRNLRGIKKILYFVLKYPGEIKKYFMFKKERKKYLSLTHRISNFDNKNIDFSNTILCSGGDQLWGYMPYNQLDRNYYLCFGSKNNKYISFSSSFGRYDFSKEEKEFILKNLKKYCFITVREESAVSFLNQLGISSNCILDPTLLVNKSVWFSICSKKIYRKRYILVYKLRQDDQLNKLAEKIQKAENEKLDILYITNTYFNKNGKGKNIINPKLEYVLQLFKNSEYVVTDSFHANVLAVIFQKNYFVHLPGDTNSRIIDFNKKIGQEKRIIDNYEECNIFDKIDYYKVDMILENEKKKSFDIIDKMIKVVESEEVS